MTRPRPLPALAALVAAGLTLLLTAAATFPAGAVRPLVAFTVTLAAGSEGLGPGASTTLTATANQDVGQTPFSIELFDATSAQFLTSCGAGTTCSTTVTQSTSTVHSYVAVIASDKAFPPSDAQATSNTVVVSWMTVHLAAAGPTALFTGGTATLTATSSIDVSPFFLDIFDTVAGTLVAQCASGTTCSVSVTRTAGYGVYAAYVAGPGNAFPPAGLRAQSPELIPVTWMAATLSATRVSLPAGTSTTLTATSTVDLTGTPYYLQLFDLFDGLRMIPICKGTTCSITVSQPSPITHSYIAFVGVVGDTSHTLPPPDLRATTNTVSVQWNPNVVPNVGGETAADAAADIAAAGLQGSQGTLVDCGAIGRVADQSPDPGTVVPAGSTVRYDIGVRPTPPKRCQ